LVALVAGVLPSLPGFFVQVGLLNSQVVPGFLGNLYHYGWFVGFAVAFTAHLIGRKMVSERRS